MLWEFIVSITSFYKQKPDIPTIITEDAMVKSTFNIPFVPLWFGTGKYIQTVLHEFIGILDTRRNYRREYCYTLEGLEIRLYIKDDHTLPYNTPILFICHGLVETASNPFINTLTDKLPQYRSVVYTRRGYDNTSLCLKSPLYYDEVDMNLVLSHLTTKYKGAPIIGVGVSAGGNILLKYMANGKYKTSIDRAFILSSTLNLNEVSNNLGWMVHRLATIKMKDYATQRKGELNYLAKLRGIEIDWNKLYKSSYVSEVDNEISTKLEGYKSVEEFFAASSSYQDIDKIEIPTIFIMSKDDPVLIQDMEHLVNHVTKNKNMSVVLTNTGGHLAWVDRVGGSWCIDRLVEYFTELEEYEY